MSDHEAEQTPAAATPGGPQDEPTTSEAENVTGNAGASGAGGVNLTANTASGGGGGGAPAPQVAEDEYPLRLVKVEDVDRHWNVAKGVWEQVTHAETGEPNFFYSLVATIDGVDIELSRWNAGRIDTRVRSLQAANQSE